ncbi:MAG: LD-carboxypeptidase [Endomicrobia bacterium]|nr:LD-carboxypeptidase [Endomicrobiia bacterium]
MNIYIITPAWIIKEKREYIEGIKNLEECGFKVLNKKFPTKLPTIIQKVKQIHKAFVKKDVKIILSQRGGYGCIKLLPYLNFDTIKKHSKIFAGFSDLSALLNVIYEKTKITTLHSPMVINFSNLTEFTKKSFLNAINLFPNKNLFLDTKIKVYKQGIAKGTLKGGNLITITSLIGTPWEVKIKNSILFLEEVDEPLYKVDRAFTQMILTKKFNKIKGLILGNFRGLKTDEIYRTIINQTKLKCPVVACNNIGHIKDKITLPIGAEVELNTYKKTLIVKKLNLPKL